MEDCEVNCYRETTNCTTPSANSGLMKHCPSVVNGSLPSRAVKVTLGLPQTHRALHAHHGTVGRWQCVGDRRLHGQTPIKHRHSLVPCQPRRSRPHHGRVLYAVHLHHDDARTLGVLGADVSYRAVPADCQRHGVCLHVCCCWYRPLLGRQLPAQVAHHQVSLSGRHRRHLVGRLRSVVHPAGRRTLQRVDFTRRTTGSLVYIL